MKNSTFIVVIILVISIVGCDNGKNNPSKLETLLPGLFPGKKNNVSMPLFNAVAGPASIELTDIRNEEDLVDGYVVRWAPVNSYDALLNITTLPWDESPVIPSDGSNPVSYTIPDLTPEKGYLVAVCSRDGKDESASRYFADDPGTPDVDNITLIFPYKADLATAAPDFSISMISNDAITVSDLYTPDVKRYRIYWREKGAGDNAWQMHDTFTDTGGGTTDRASYTISYLKGWTAYQIRACAVTLSGVEGIMVTKEATTASATSCAISAFSRYYGDKDCLQEYGIQFLSIPENTVRYEITGTVFFLREWLFIWTGVAAVKWEAESHSLSTGTVRYTVPGVTLYRDVLPAFNGWWPLKEIKSVTMQLVIRLTNANGDVVTERRNFYLAL